VIGAEFETASAMHQHLHMKFQTAVTQGDSALTGYEVEAPALAKLRVLVETEPDNRQIVLTRYPMVGGHGTLDQYMVDLSLLDLQND
jgi:hypothetical protein